MMTTEKLRDMLAYMSATSICGHTECEDCKKLFEKQYGYKFNGCVSNRLYGYIEKNEFDTFVANVLTRLKKTLDDKYTIPFPIDWDMDAVINLLTESGNK